MCRERRQTMQTTLRRRTLTTLIAFGSFILVLLALTHPPLQWGASAKNPTAESPTNATEADVQVLHVPDDYDTIQAAVNAATEGDTIMVAACVYQENVVVTTSGLRPHGTSAVVPDGVAVHGVGINVHATSSNPFAGVEVSGFEIRNFTEGVLALNATDVKLHHNDVHDNEVAPGKLPG